MICNGKSILNTDLNITLDNSFDEDDATILIRLLAWHIKFEKCKTEELMPIAWHCKRWCNIFIKNQTYFYWGVVKVCVCSIKHGGIETFCLLSYWYILSSTHIKILNYIKSLCIIFLLHWFKYFDQKNQTLYAKVFTL